MLHTFVELQSLLHPQNSVPPVLTPSDKPAIGPVPINNNFNVPPTPVQPPVRNDFPPQMVPPVVMQNNQPPVFTGQDIDLRSLDPRASDPRLSRMADQDMRTLPGQLPNPLPPIGDK